MKDCRKLEKMLIALDDCRGKFFCLKRDHRILTRRTQDFTRTLLPMLKASQPNIQSSQILSLASPAQKHLQEAIELTLRFITTLGDTEEAHEESVASISESDREMPLLPPAPTILRELLPKLCTQCRPKAEAAFEGAEPDTLFLEEDLSTSPVRANFQTEEEIPISHRLSPIFEGKFEVSPSKGNISTSPTIAPFEEEKTLVSPKCSPSKTKALNSSSPSTLYQLKASSEEVPVNSISVFKNLESEFISVPPFSPFANTQNSELLTPQFNTKAEHPRAQFTLGAPRDDLLKLLLSTPSIQNNDSATFSKEFNMPVEISPNPPPSFHPSHKTSSNPPTSKSANLPPSLKSSLGPMNEPEYLSFSNTNEPIVHHKCNSQNGPIPSFHQPRVSQNNIPSPTYQSIRSALAKTEPSDLSPPPPSSRSYFTKKVEGKTQPTSNRSKRLSVRDLLAPKQSKPAQESLNSLLDLLGKKRSLAPEGSSKFSSVSQTTNPTLAPQSTTNHPHLPSPTCVTAQGKKLNISSSTRREQNGRSKQTTPSLTALLKENLKVASKARSPK